MFKFSAVIQDLPSFPTRRSSDLAESADFRLRRGSAPPGRARPPRRWHIKWLQILPRHNARRDPSRDSCTRSEEHTSELQSRQYLVCRLLLEKKKNRHSHDARLTH